MPPSEDASSLTRRAFLGTVAGAGAAMLAGCGRKAPTIPGDIVHPNATRGHRLRTGGFPAPSETLRCGVAIVGGGIAGLATARELQRKGREDFLLLELEDQAGGNSSFGSNSVSGYPWGAHYVTLPTDDAAEVMELYRELGLIKGEDEQKRPIYDEQALVTDPAERLYVLGRWQEGLTPRYGALETDLQEIQEFAARIDAFKHLRGSDGRRAFTIPVERSSRDPELLALDRLSMAAWLEAQGWKSERLRWHVGYACRDDFGANPEHVSAWAGIHYFAARDGIAANAESDLVLTWPEGNGWLVRQLREPLGTRVRSGCLAWNVAPRGGGGVAIDAFDFARERSFRLEAEKAIVCVPRFVARRIVEPLRSQASEPLEYGPWVVANVTVDRLPRGLGAAPAWDNVFYQSRSLGYVNARHQEIGQRRDPTVLTWYQALCDGPPADERQKAFAMKHAHWCEHILADLTRVHPEIEQTVRRIDVCVWGHGMIRPVPGLMWSGARERSAEATGDIHYAHSDLSGISIFEEAYTRGVQVARSLT